MQLDFIKGHMGGNTILLLYGEQLPAGRELGLSVKALGANYLWCHECGILYRADSGADLKIKISEPTLPSFISACGGMTQVLGKALVETDLGDHFKIKIEEPVTRVVIETEAGLTSLDIHVAGGKVQRIITDMGAFLNECREKGIASRVLEGIEACQVGVVLVANADKIKETYPAVDFVRWDSSTRDLLSRIQDEFHQKTGECDYYFVLYDWNPERSGDLRVLFPHCIPQNYFEPACGTGSIALGAALLFSGELQQRRGLREGIVKLKLEAGGSIQLGGPDTTELFLYVAGGELAGASFSHSLVKITATGQVRL